MMAVETVHCTVSETRSCAAHRFAVSQRVCLFKPLPPRKSSRNEKNWRIVSTKGTKKHQGKDNRLEHRARKTGFSYSFLPASRPEAISALSFFRASGMPAV